MIHYKHGRSGSYSEGASTKKSRHSIPATMAIALSVCCLIAVLGVGALTVAEIYHSIRVSSQASISGNYNQYHAARMMATTNASTYESDDYTPMRSRISLAPYVRTMDDDDFLFEAAIPPELIEEEHGIISTRLGVEINSYDETCDYSRMIKEVYSMAKNDPDNADHLLGLCEIYEIQRNLKIEKTGVNAEQSHLFDAANTLDDIEAILHPHIPYMEYTTEEAKKLAALIYAEAGSSWITDEHQRAVGSVVLCRLASPDWNYWTIFEVIYAPGQYPNTCNATYYDERAYNNAIYLLENGPTLEGYYQGNRREGGTEDVAIFRYPNHPASITYITK